MPPELSAYRRCHPIGVPAAVVMACLHCRAASSRRAAAAATAATVTRFVDTRGVQWAIKLG